ncbi:hypothetical protein MASR1M12_37880 [Erysipelotrichia bacterium]|jgi:hypothetical protein
MRYKKVGVLLLFLLVILTIIPSTAKDKKRNMAMSLLRQARAAHDSGDHEKAQNLLLKAKFIWKDLPDPGWSLSSYHETGQKKISSSLITRDSGNELLFNFLASPTVQKQRLLEVYLKKYPDETTIQEQYLTKAKLSGLIKEFPSDQAPRAKAADFFNLKYLALLVILSLTIWQAAIAIREIRTGNRR